MGISAEAMSGYAQDIHLGKDGVQAVSVAGIDASQDQCMTAWPNNSYDYG